jgi:hypothetical protein
VYIRNEALAYHEGRLVVPPNTGLASWCERRAPGGGTYSVRGLAEGAMDEDGNSFGRFRLPKSFGASDDPVEGNPFPP